MTITLRAERETPYALWKVRAMIMPCHEDFPGVAGVRWPRLAIDTGCGWTTISRGYLAGGRLERDHRAVLADGRETPCGRARTHLIFTEGGRSHALTIAASVHLEGNPDAGGLLGLDLIERLSVDDEGATVTVRDEQRQEHVYPWSVRECVCERAIAANPRDPATELGFLTEPWLKRSPLADAAQSEDG